MWSTMFAGSGAFSQTERSPDTAIKVIPTVTFTVEEIMERARYAPPPSERIKIRKIRPDRSKLPQNPRSVDAAAFPFTGQAAPASGEKAPAQPQTVGLSFNGFTGTSATGPFPPDNMGSIGPTQYIVAVNGIIRSFNATTGTADGVLNIHPDVFFSTVMTPVGGGVTYNFTSDPRIRYDRYSGKWIILIIDVPNGGSVANRVLIGVSNSSTISAGTVWSYSWFLGQTGLFIDYPTIGMDINAVYIGGNMFTTGGSFQQTNGYVINRANLMSGGAYTVYPFTSLASGSGAGPFTPQGVDNFDGTATQGYFIGVDNVTFGTLMLRRVSTPAGVPTISSNISVTVNSTSYPQKAPHLGNTGGSNGNLAAIDDRLFAAMIRGGHLWTAHTIYVNASGTTTSANRDGVRWYDLTNLSSAPTVFQSGTIYDPAASNPRWYFFPTIMISGQGHAAFALATAGVNDRANAATTGRLASDAAGTTQSIVLTTASSTAYNPTGDPGGSNGRRWGDYSYVSLDPKDDMTLWMVNQYCSGTNVYGSYVSKLIAPPPATPSSCSPAMVYAGQASVNVVVTGTSAGGSGFYDPGTNLPSPAVAFNHISATVSGGVTVNSVTYTSPTQITLNLNTTAATGGLKNIVVTNPDGQSLTGTNLLRVCPVITVTNPASATAVAGQVLTRSFTSSGGSNPVTYTTASALPPGLTLASTGALSGIPSQTGVWPIVVTATDANGCAGTGTTYTLSITCPTVNPVIMPVGPTTFCSGGSVQLAASSGNAIQFSGSGNYLTVPSTVNSNFSANRITVEGWFFLTAVSAGTPALVGEAFLGDLKVTFTVYLNGQQIIAGFYSGAWTTAAGTTNLALNTWTHVAATYDQTAIRIYVNGVAAGSTPATAILPTGTEEWRIARRWDLAEYFQGRMDEVRIWNTARTQGQIQGSMNSILAPSTGGLVAYYRFNDGTGTVAADLTNHGYNATFTGSPVWVIPSSAPLTGYNAYIWSNGATASSITVSSAGSYTVSVTDSYGCQGFSAPVAVSVTPLPAAAGSVSGPAVTAQGHSGIAYSVAAIANATGYNWTLPSGAGIASGANTNSITVDFSGSAVSGNITVNGTNTCGNGTTSPPLAVTVIPSTYSSGSVTVGSGISQCYNAMQTIIIPGGGGTFTVQSGGSATMIAGQTIRYEPVTGVLSGGYLHGYITTSNQFCGGMVPAMMTVVTGTESPVEVILSPALKVYPNPTTGQFILEFTGEPGPVRATVGIFDTRGALVSRSELQGSSKYSLSLSSMPSGLYFMHVVSGKTVESLKLIKL